MNKEFIPYEQASELKKLRFDEECMAFYEPGDKEVKVVGVNQRYNDPLLLSITDFCAPLYQQAFRWFREKYGWHHNVLVKRVPSIEYGYQVIAIVGGESVWKIFDFKSYEEAELACLKKLIEIVKNK